MVQRLRGVGDEEANEKVKGLYNLQKRAFGIVLPPMRLYAYSPRIHEAVEKVFSALNGISGIRGPLRHLVAARVAKSSGCPFCTDFNSWLALKDGYSRDELRDALGDYKESDNLQTKAKLALEYADAVAAGNVADDFFQKIRQNFTEEELVELTFITSFEVCLSRFNRALGIESLGLVKELQGLNHSLDK
jgi:AhpD family alkylhydroperoxidase